MSDFTEAAIDAMDEAELRRALKATVKAIDNSDGPQDVPQDLFLSLVTTICGVVVTYGQEQKCGDHSHFLMVAPRGLHAGNYGLTRQRHPGAEDDLLVVTPLVDGENPHGNE